jgi:NusA-like KH domain protein
MMKKLDRKYIQYINLFEKYSRTRTRYCFEYNNFIIFVVPSPIVSKSIGPDGKNVKKMSSVINRKIKIISMPENESDMGKFILDIIDPLKFKSIEVKGEEVIISAGSQYKAALIGRNKRRLLELREIIKQYFNKELKII